MGFVLETQGGPVSKVEAGLNRISRRVLSEAAAAMAGEKSVAQMAASSRSTRIERLDIGFPPGDGVAA